MRDFIIAEIVGYEQAVEGPEVGESQREHCLLMIAGLTWYLLQVEKLDIWDVLAMIDVYKKGRVQ